MEHIIQGFHHDCTAPAESFPNSNSFLPDYSPSSDFFFCIDTEEHSWIFIRQEEI